MKTGVEYEDKVKRIILGIEERNRLSADKTGDEEDRRWIDKEVTICTRLEKYEFGRYKIEVMKLGKTSKRKESYTYNTMIQDLRFKVLRLYDSDDKSKYNDIPNR
jgi:hypothetical protein